VPLPGGGVEIKKADKHVEAGDEVISGQGFNSPRLHWQKAPEVRGFLRLRSHQAGALRLLHRCEYQCAGEHFAMERHPMGPGGARGCSHG